MAEMARFLIATTVAGCGLLLAVTSAACTGDGATVVDADPTSTPAVSPTVAASNALELDEYLVRVLQIQDKVNDQPAGYGLDSVLQDPEAVLHAFPTTESAASDETERALTELRNLTPPPEAEAFHAGLIASYEGGIELLADIGRAIAAEDDQAMSVAKARIDQQTAEYLDLINQQSQLTLQALRRGAQTPMRRYIAETIELRSRLLPPLLISRDSDLNDQIAAMEELESAWATLIPPPELQSLHDLEEQDIAQTLQVLREVQTAILEGNLEGILAAAEALQEDDAYVDAQFEDVLIAVLSAD